MDTISPPIRNTARALILRDQNILLLRKFGYAGKQTVPNLALHTAFEICLPSTAPT
jgi:hypothetical protein